MKMTARAIAGLVLAVGILSAAVWAGEYEAEIGVWRSKRAAALQADGGWLSVAGLTWLKEGPNRFGTSAQNEIVLPIGSTPGNGGVFEFHDGKTTVSLSGGVKGFLGKSPVTATTEMKPDTDGGETLVIGDLTIQVIKRAERYGIRLRDRNSSYRKSFSGLKWYPVHSEWKIAARFVAYSPPRPIRISSVIGTSESMLSPGYAAFSVGGVEVKLDGVLEAPDSRSLFFIFRDQTSGKETYGGGRFLYADLPKQGMVVLDFNKAYNPPCAFTPYATCPVPPQQNWLTVAIPAGEKNYGGLAH